MQAAKQSERCKATVRLGGEDDLAQCMRAKVEGADYCAQHAKIYPSGQPASVPFAPNRRSLNSVEG